MTLGDIIKPDNIIPELQASDRWEAIDELVDRLVASGDLDETQRGPVLAAVRKREDSMSTGIGFGIGIPHASSDVLRQLVAAFGRSKAGVEFDALDAQPVSLVVLFLVPQGEFQPHLHTLATIAKMLHRREVRQELEEAPDAAAIHAVISKHSNTG
jgi:mannitol/fructose-specific phosphotransferase system IIA component (Ntr-type)